MSQKCSINPMIGTENMIEAPRSFGPGIAEALAALDPAMGCPVLLVDSAVVIPAVKAAILHSGRWPGSDLGAPLPWCGTLEQAWSEMSLAAVCTSSAPWPRRTATRAVHLAQLLLDTPGIAASLGHAPSAALDLAVRWVELFDGWEWLEAAGADMTGIRSDTDTALLCALQDGHRTDRDRAVWASRHLRRQPSGNVARDGERRDEPPPRLWFCSGRRVPPRDLAMACVLWDTTPDRVTVWRLPPVADPAGDLPQVDAGKRIVMAAATLEETARVAAQSILEWRREGLDDIAVVALDRRAVRRLRALLERAGEALDDRSGWALDTTVVATALVGLNDCLCGPVTTQSVLEWIHSPLVSQALEERHGMGVEGRRSLDAAMRAVGRVVPLQIADLVVRGLLPDIGLGAPTPAGRRSLDAWVEQLMSAAQASGLLDLLLSDAAGQALVGALTHMRADACAQDGASPISAALWRAVLAAELGQSRFVDVSPGAAVRTCSMASLLWRGAQAVIWVGADAGRLPGRDPARFFDPVRFAEMGLRLSPECVEADGIAEFSAILAQPQPMVFVACSEQPDAQVALSPWLEMQIGCGAIPAAQAAASCLKTAEIQWPTSVADGVLPTVWSAGLPAELSVSALQSLVECPYQFMMQTLLGLKPLEVIAEDAPPTDLGSLLHRALAACIAPASPPEGWATVLEREIERLLDHRVAVRSRPEVIPTPLPVHIRQSLREEALAHVPALSAWLEQRVPNGERLVAVEAERPLWRQLPSLPVVVKGRIDRREQGRDGVTLIDFKTTSARDLRKRMTGQGTEIQLALYAWMTDLRGPHDEAFYLSMNTRGCEPVALASKANDGIDTIAGAVVARVESGLSGIVAGDPIAASGVDRDPQVCERCSVRGVCRRDDAFLTHVSGIAPLETAP